MAKGKGIKTQAELNAYIMLQMERALDNEISHYVKDEQSKQVEKVVYNSYTPKRYERRRDEGGLSDIRNMRHVINPNGAFVLSMVITNETTGKSMDGKPQYDRPIAYGVEMGHAIGGTYDAPASPYMLPRRFMKATFESLEGSTQFREVIANALRRKGLPVK